MLEYLADRELQRLGYQPDPVCRQVAAIIKCDTRTMSDSSSPMGSWVVLREKATIFLKRSSIHLSYNSPVQLTQGCMCESPTWQPPLYRTWFVKIITASNHAFALSDSGVLYHYSLKNDQLTRNVIGTNVDDFIVHDLVIVLERNTTPVYCYTFKGQKLTSSSIVTSDPSSTPNFMVRPPGAWLYMYQFSARYQAYERRFVQFKFVSEMSVTSGKFKIAGCQIHWKPHGGLRVRRLK